MVTKRGKGYEDLDENDGSNINPDLDPVVPQEIEMASVSVVPDGIQQTIYIIVNEYSIKRFILDTFTVSQAVNALGFGWFQVKLSLWTGLCWMADSMEMTILSILSPALHCDWQITR